RAFTVHSMPSPNPVKARTTLSRPCTTPASMTQSPNSQTTSGATPAKAVSKSRVLNAAWAWRSCPRNSSARGLLNRDPVAHRVLGDYVRFHELQHVVRAACLHPDARAPVPAERLARHHRPCDVAVHVEVPDRRAAGHVVDRR